MVWKPKKPKAKRAPRKFIKRELPPPRPPKTLREIDDALLWKQYCLSKCRPEDHIFADQLRAEIALLEPLF